MFVYAVFIREINERTNSYIHMLIAIKRNEEDAKSLVKELPAEAGPYYIACVLE